MEHSAQAVPQQARHLVDPDKCARTEHRFGDIAGRYVIYRGESLEENAQGVRYLNVEGYLRGLGEGRWREGEAPAVSAGLCSVAARRTPSTRPPLVRRRATGGCDARSRAPGKRFPGVSGLRRCRFGGLTIY